MTTSFPVITGDVVTQDKWNGLAQFTIDAQSGTSYTLGSADAYQVLVNCTSASAKTIYIPTDATYNFAVGTAITILNSGAGAATIQATSSGTTTVVSAGATSAAPTVAQYKTAVAIKTAANAWTVVGAVA